MRVWLALVGLMVPSLSFAQDKVTNEEMEKATLAKAEADKKPPPDGWNARAKVGLTGSLSSNRQVVGAEEGTTIQVGVVLGVGADLRAGQNRWENQLDLQLAGSKTPQIDRFVKSADVLDITSTYFHTLESAAWFGFFGRLKFNTQMLPTKVVRALPYTVVRTDPNGLPIDTFAVDAQTGISTTNAFEPITLRETLGVFVNPYETPDFSFKVRLGAAAQEIIDQDGFVVIAEDAGATTLNLKQLQGSFTFGAELGLATTGTLVPEVLTWKLNVDLFQPIVTTSDSELSRIEQLNAEVVLGVSLHVAKWLSLEYLFTAKRIPLILDAWQVQNLLVLSASFDLL